MAFPFCPPGPNIKIGVARARLTSSKQAAATLLGTAPPVSQKAIRAMHLPQEPDIIKQARNNKKGFLFWTGGVYAWHPSAG